MEVQSKLHLQVEVYFLFIGCGVFVFIVVYLSCGFLAVDLVRQPKNSF